MGKTVYLIADRKWQDVLSLVPISIWTESPSRQPLLTTAITRVAWREEDNADAQGTIQFLSEGGSVCFGELRGAEYQALTRSHSPCPLAIRLSGPFDQPESRLDLEMEGGIWSVLSLPQLSLRAGEERTLHVATDGSTYADDGLQTLVQAQPDRPVQKVPALVYHQEANGIDVDSTLHFLRGYLGQTSEATIIHIGPFPAGLPALLTDLCERTRKAESVRALQKAKEKEDNIDTWVIVARDDYRSGLVAAAFASLHHAFLFFLDADNLADYEDMSAGGKKVYLIGDIDEQVKEHFKSQAETLESYTCEETQQLYLSQTLTDKIILVNPDDLKLEVEEYNPILLNVLQGEIHRVYGRMSLVAPFLAAAKHELILPISSTNPYTIDYFLEGFVKATAKSRGIKMQYLTIMASPEAIPMAISIGEHRNLSGDVWVELDGRHYASLGQNEAEIDLAVGRIFGITISDCSAYVARVLFFDDLHRQPDKAALLIINTVYLAIDKYWTPDVRAQFGGSWKCFGFLFSIKLDLQSDLENRHPSSDLRQQFEKHDILLSDSDNDVSITTEKEGSLWRISDIGRDQMYIVKRIRDKEMLNIYCFGEKASARAEEIRECYRDATLILYIGHADCNGVREIIDTTEPYYREMYLNFPVIIGAACLTGAYEWIKRDQRCRSDRYKLTNLFVAQNIRRGAMGQQCAVSHAPWHEECDELLQGLYVTGLSLGKAFQEARNAEFRRHRENPDYDNATSGKIWGDAHYVLVGDPTFKPKRDSQ
jgi:hypothetical protein